MSRIPTVIVHDLVEHKAEDLPDEVIEALEQELERIEHQKKIARLIIERQAELFRRLAQT